MLSKDKVKIFDEIANETFVKMSFIYANYYSATPKEFINSFKNFESIRMACAWIIDSYKRNGAFKDCLELGKDFSEWCNKQDIEEKWKRVLNEVLIIIYAITKNK